MICCSIVFASLLPYNIMEMPLLASIDVGSNTFRLLIGKISQNNRLIDVFTDRIITRLGDSVGETGRLQERNMADSLSALRRFASTLAEYRVEQISAVATSALREASNADSFIQRVFAETGIRIDVITGKREAELTLKGLLASFPHSEFGRPESAFIVDLGGGSTECIVYRDTHVVFMQSIPVGVIKLSAQFLKSDPPSQKDIRDMDTEILSVLNKLHAEIRDVVDQRTQFIGTAGTFSTLASIDLGLTSYSREKLHMHGIPLNRLQAMSKRLISLPLKERKKVPGLEPERADLIIPGLHFTINTMRLFHFSSLTVSEHGILEGVLMEIHGKNISET
jgi:exopolyphosphatase / guanosine-5'-triphosphate,3'-diphosphate pyrophosphatase